MSTAVSVAVECLQQYQAQLSRLIAEYKKQQAIVGDAASGKDTPFLRQKIRRTRDRYGELDAKVQAGLREAATGGASTATFDDVRGQLRRLKQEYEAIDRDVRAKEARSAPTHTHDDPSSAADATTAATMGGSQQQQRQGATALTAAMRTEERYQRERLEAVVEVEHGVAELHHMQREFNALMREQQPGLDTVGRNIDRALKHTSNGVAELRKANGK